MRHIIDQVCDQYDDMKSMMKVMQIPIAEVVDFYFDVDEGDLASSYDNSLVLVIMRPSGGF